MSIRLKQAVLVMLITVLNSVCAYARLADAQVVNLLDAGIARIQYLSGPQNSSSLQSCVFNPDKFIGGSFQSVLIDTFTLTAGVKYVMPINRNASCDGFGIGVQIYPSSIKNVDQYLENIATGQRYAIVKPDGCQYSVNRTYNQLFTNSDLKGYQLVIVSNKSGVTAQGVFYPVDPNGAGDNNIKFYCEYFRKW